MAIGCKRIGLRESLVDQQRLLQRSSCLFGNFERRIFFRPHAGSKPVQDILAIGISTSIVDSTSPFVE